MANNSDNWFSTDKKVDRDRDGVDDRAEGAGKGAGIGAGLGGAAGAPVFLPAGSAEKSHNRPQPRSIDGIVARSLEVRCELADDL